MSNIKKIWGIRNRLLETSQTEIDLLYLDKDTTCSIHSHKNKINRFVLISGNVQIKCNLGIYVLKIGVPFDVEPPTIHQFVAFEDSTMIELAFVKNNKIDSNDIDRIQQGGKTIKGKFYTMDNLLTKFLNRRKQ